MRRTQADAHTKPSSISTCFMSARISSQSIWWTFSREARPNLATKRCMGGFSFGGAGFFSGVFSFVKRCMGVFLGGAGFFFGAFSGEFSFVKRCMSGFSFGGAGFFSGAFSGEFSFVSGEFSFVTSQLMALCSCRRWKDLAAQIATEMSPNGYGGMIIY